MACVMIGMNSVVWGYGISWLMSLVRRLKASFLRRTRASLADASQGSAGECESDGSRRRSDHRAGQAACARCGGVATPGSKSRCGRRRALVFHRAGRGEDSLPGVEVDPDRILVWRVPVSGGA